MNILSQPDGNMFWHEGDLGVPVRILFAFDPGRNAILLVGGDKHGDKRFYEKMIPLADTLLDKHLDKWRNQK